MKEDLVPTKEGARALYYDLHYHGRLTWRMLLKREPRLAALRRRVMAIKDDGKAPCFCANELWYGEQGFRHELTELVGEEREEFDPVLVSVEAYDLAYERLYRLLPNCRNCSCV